MKSKLFSDSNMADPSKQCRSCKDPFVFRVCTTEYDGTHTTYYVCRDHAKQMDVDRFVEIAFTRVNTEPNKQNKFKLLSFYADDAAAGKAGLKKGDLWCTYNSHVHEKL